MSQESSKVLMRQWQVISYLTNGQYVSTSEIKGHLEHRGFDVELRTIQRDLVMLEQVFPLECRRDSMPHSWRWKPLQDARVKGLKVSEALTLRLIEEQLKDVISPDLMRQLAPLFEKAKIVMGNLPMLSDDTDESTTQPRRPMDGRSRGLFPQNPFDMMVFELTSMISSVLHNPEKQQNKQAQSALVQSIALLRKQGLGVFADELKALV